MATKKLSVKPLFDRVLVEALSDEEKLTKTKAGIFLPESSSKEKTDRGKVVEVGPGKINDAGKRVPVSVKKGQTVIFSEYSAEKISAGDKEYYLVSEGNILAVIE